jgi:hypothetical protein
MPDWTLFSLNKENSQERQQIKDAARRISTYDLDLIRLAFERRMKNNPLEFGKLFVLNKYLFNLPDAIRRDSPHFQFFGGGWVGMPMTGDPNKRNDSDELSLRWPWSVDDDGKWQLTGKFGGFNGPPYDALAAFDYYGKQFGKREMPAR